MCLKNGGSVCCGRCLTQKKTEVLCEKCGGIIIAYSNKYGICNKCEEEVEMPIPVRLVSI
jgi:hypothetical protein